MSECTTQMRAVIRARVIEVLAAHAGRCFPTQELLGRIEEAETSSVLASICADLFRSGQIDRGPKAINAQGREVNTWTSLAKAKAKAKAKGKGKGATPTVETVDPYLSEAMTAECARSKAMAAEESATVGMAAQESAPVEMAAVAGATSLPGHDLADDAAPDLPLTVDADIAPAATITPSPVASVAVTPLPNRWLPEMRLRLGSIDAGPINEITLRIHNEGNGAFWSMKVGHNVAFDPGDADFLPRLGRELCAVMDALAPAYVWAGAPTSTTAET